MPEETSPSGAPGAVTARRFPADFLWGSATAAYQIEGAVHEGGRGTSIWDTFSHTPDATLNGDTGDVADDHYHRWAEDVKHIADLGLGAYRFSISWPRVQPGGSGEFNAEGIAFYSTLVDALIAAGVKPVVTLYHWDLPQELEDQGGWTNRATAYAFAEYARRMAVELGDRIDVWTTINEPWCAAYLGYANGEHAPGRTDPEAALSAAHHLNLAHGLAGRAIREVLGDDAKVSITLNLHVNRPADPGSALDREAARRVDAVSNRIFLQPLLEGIYPPDLLADLEHVTDWAFIHPGDAELCRVPMDVLGINYYATGTVRFAEGAGRVPEGETPASVWIGVRDVEGVPVPGPYTAMGWNIDPSGMTELLLSLHATYPDQALMVTENGAAFDDEVAADGRVHDVPRVSYLHDHIEAVGAALDGGADVRGYFAWSLLDNFEWAFGYDRRFGIIRVDYDTQVRTWKDSAYWYRSLVTTGVLPAVDHIRY